LDIPKRGTFARAKYSTRIPRVHQSLSLKWTCFSGLATAGNLLKNGSNVSLRVIDYTIQEIYLFILFEALDYISP
jgi:hypothetical protein